MVNVRFEKVKNEYRFIREDGKYWYLDINDGKWYGIKGNKIKNTSRPSFSIARHPNNTCQTLLGELQNLALTYSPSTVSLKQFDAIFSILLNENKENKQIRGFNVWKLHFYYENIKMLSEYLRSTENEEVIRLSTDDFEKFLFRKKYGHYVNFLNREISYSFEYVVGKCSKDLNMNLDLFMEKYGMNLVHYYNKGFFSVLNARYLVDYYKMCEDLDVTPKKGDFIKNYHEIRKIRDEKSE